MKKILITYAVLFQFVLAGTAALQEGDYLLINTKNDGTIEVIKATVFTEDGKKFLDVEDKDIREPIEIHEKDIYFQAVYFKHNHRVVIFSGKSGPYIHCYRTECDPEDSKRELTNYRMYPVQLKLNTK